MPFVLFVNTDISHLNNALSDMLANILKNRGNWFYYTYLCWFIFVHSIQQPLVPYNTYCLKKDMFKSLILPKS